MSLSRFAPPLRAQKCVLVHVRFAQHAPAVPTSGGANVADAKPGFFQKIVHRFKGVPLPGETELPKSMFDDMGKFYVPPALVTLPKDFKEGPERDLKNYPYPVRAEHPPPTRMLMFPDSWCTPFHKVTGTSGPYLFFGGVLAFYINKELWVFEEHGHMLLGWILFYLILSRTLGYRSDKFFFTKYNERVDYFKGLIQEDLKEAIDFRKRSTADTTSFNSMKAEFPTVFQENLALQLEATYRRNVDKVSTELKRRLDYLKEVEETKRRFESDMFMKSILEGVQNVIENNEGNVKQKYLDNCVAEIKNLQI